jgi:peptide/nickel transport system substrate-binding protein
VDSDKKQVSYLKKTKNIKASLFEAFFAFPKNLFKYKKSSSYNVSEHARIQKELDKRLVYSLSRSRIPTLRQLKYIGRYLSRFEKKIIITCVTMIVLSSVFLGANIYANNLELVPVAGGEYIEGLIGSPQNINPLYARSDVDSDLTFLIYSSLFTRGVNGELNKDLVDDFFVSTDNKVYEITIRNDVKWHDGTDLTIEDVVFTFNAIQDQQYKSHLRQSFVGVSIEVVDERTIKFLLPDPYAAFLDLLTFGILPASIWSEISPETASLAIMNLKPIGSGPYKSKSWARDNSGNIKEYQLERNVEYYGEVPYIDLGFKFYKNFDEAISDLNDKKINGISYLPSEYKEMIADQRNLQYHKILYPQITLIFLNQEKNKALAQKEVRQALSYAIDKRAVVNDVMKSEASIVYSPILENSFAHNPEINKYFQDISKANELLDQVGWKIEEIGEEKIETANQDMESDDEALKTKASVVLALGEGVWRKKGEEYLIINLKTVDRSENSQVIDEIRKYWEAIGVKVVLETVPQNKIQTDIIRTKNFEALFFAQVLGSDPDPYAFWHSSQIENGFNISGYENKEVDKLLEEARLEAERTLRKDRYGKFQEIIAEEAPVIFMYSPLYTYVQSQELKGFEVKNIISPKDRFTNVFDWYLKTGKKLIINK